MSAALEPVRRLALEDGATSPNVIRTKEDVEKIFRRQIAGLPRKEFWTFYLSSANMLIGQGDGRRDGVSGTVIDYRL